MIETPKSICPNPGCKSVRHITARVLWQGKWYVGDIENCTDCHTVWFASLGQGRDGYLGIYGNEIETIAYSRLGREILDRIRIMEESNRIIDTVFRS